MIFKETELKGAYIIELEPIEDERGFFARSFCQKEFELHGITMNVAQCNISYNKMKGTLRGMHYQAAPYKEAKIVSCIRGSIYDVIIDLRSDSPTYCQWIAVELSAVSSEQLAASSEPSAVSSQDSAPGSQPSDHRSSPSAHRSPLTAHYKMLYVPQGFAHGFLTLADNTEVFYHMAEFYAPGYGRGIRWDDPVFGIKWPEEINVISDQDKGYPDFTP
jgi:dTDP-4-dehydrorhamnose 3,5-epimerase